MKTILNHNLYKKKIDLNKKMSYGSNNCNRTCEQQYFDAWGNHMSSDFITYNDDGQVLGIQTEIYCY